MSTNDSGLCPTCGGGKWPGRQETECVDKFHGPKWGTQEFHRAHPIYYTVEDMTKPKEELIAKIRHDLTNLRGQLHDIKFGFGWSDSDHHGGGGHDPRHQLPLPRAGGDGTLEEMERTNEHEKKNEEIRRAAATLPPGGV